MFTCFTLITCLPTMFTYIPSLYVYLRCLPTCLPMMFTYITLITCLPTMFTYITLITCLPTLPSLHVYLRCLPTLPSLHVYLRCFCNMLPSCFQFATSMLGAVALTACSLTVAPPAGLPDLFAVLVSTYSCGHFVLFLLYFHWLQYTIDADAHSYRNRNQVTDMKHTAIKSRKLLKKTT